MKKTATRYDDFDFLPSFPVLKAVMRKNDYFFANPSLEGLDLNRQSVNNDQIHLIRP